MHVFLRRMIIYVTLFICILSGSNGWSDNRQRKFKDEFLFGAASAAYQVEGAWDTDGKGESIWDRYLHNNPEVIADGRNGDVASDSYHNYQRDVEMLRELGVDYYRFSISWPRVLPTGFPNNQNEKGFQYYDNLINELLKYNIQPMVTLYHFDLPQALQDLGGWSNPLSANWFESYAKTVFDRYADRVQYWVTVNQPNHCMEGYGDSISAPAINQKGIADYLCVKNVLMAHAMAYRLYEKEYKNKYKGSVGIAISLNWGDPINNKTENVQAAEDFREFTINLYMNPIWSKTGDFPNLVKETVARNSKQQGFIGSRLPTLTSDEIKLLKGSADFLGMNHYTTFLVKRSKNQFPSPSFDGDLNVDLKYRKQWKQSQSPWLRSAPYGLYKALIYINKQYDYPPIFITENGWSTGPGLKDESRVENMRNYLNALLLGIEDAADVKGYTAWSLLDNIEWTAGTSERFGLYEVDFDSPEKTRTARLSALVYKRIIQKRIVEDNWTPKNLKINISNTKVKTKVEL